MVIAFGLLLSLALSIFWIWMLIVAVTREPTTVDKVLWALVIIFTHFIGALIYYFVRYSPRTRLAR